MDHNLTSLLFPLHKSRFVLKYLLSTLESHRFDSLSAQTRSMQRRQRCLVADATNTYTEPCQTFLTNTAFLTNLPVSTTTGHLGAIQ